MVVENTPPIYAPSAFMNWGGALLVVAPIFEARRLISRFRFLVGFTDFPERESSLKSECSNSRALGGVSPAPKRVCGASLWGRNSCRGDRAARQARSDSIALGPTSFEVTHGHLEHSVSTGEAAGIIERR